MAVKFTKVKKRKYLETWFNKNRKTGLISIIYCDPTGNYHWVINCFIKRCGFKRCIRDEENCNKYLYYNSLDDGLIYGSFDECREAIVKWFKIRK